MNRQMSDWFLSFYKAAFEADAEGTTDLHLDEVDDKMSKKVYEALLEQERREDVKMSRQTPALLRD